MMQFVELHFRSKPNFTYEDVKVRAQTILKSELDCSDASTSDKAFLFIHKEHLCKFSDGQVIPAQTAILTWNRPIDLGSYRQDIQQSWRCQGAEDLLRGCNETVIELSKPDALAFRYTQQIIAPADYLAACSQEPILRPGSLNVRFFNISNSDGDMIMDVRGLADLGLHDLQCHFRKLDPKQVAGVLFNTALYIFENGPVIKAGETIAGIESNSKWRCQFENSLLEPKRELMDLDPGAAHAAGKREA